MGQRLQGQFWSPLPPRRAWGHREFVTVKNPASATNFEFVVPSPFNWLIQNLKFELTTSAEVGNRGPGMALTTGTGQVMEEMTAQLAQAASKNVQYIFNNTYMGQQTLIGTRVAVPLTPTLLVPGDLIKSSVSGLLTGDEVKAITIFAEVFEDSPTHDIERLEAMAQRIEDLERRLS